MLSASLNKTFFSLSLSKSNRRLGLVWSAMRNNITLRPNFTMVILGYLDKKIPFRDTCAIMVATASGSHHDLEVAPAVFRYQFNSSSPVEVRLSNTNSGYSSKRSLM